MDRLFYIHPLGNIYEIYANLTVMTNLNLNHFLIITKDELCLKGTFVKESFMFVTFFLDFYEKSLPYLVANILK